MPLTKVTSGVRTLGTGEVATANMAVDPTNASNLSSGSVPTAQLGNVDTAGLEDDIALLGFKVASNGSLAKYNLVDQTVDAFEDASGIDASASTNESRDSSGKYYSGAVSQSGATAAFTSTGAATWTAPDPSPASVEVLIVAGGGSGGTGWYAGGGGAGGVVHDTDYAVVAGTVYDLTVGVGGTGHGSDGSPGDNGDDSVWNINAEGSGITMTANGGGGGGSRNNDDGVAGGSGGGGGDNGGASGASNQTSPTGATGYGFAGGASNNDSGAGGGGATQAGSGPTSNVNGGYGGAGKLFSTWVAYGTDSSNNASSGSNGGYFAGGGAGAAHGNGTPEDGGVGGGADGVKTGGGNGAQSNTGGGGGGGHGSGSSGGNGGSGFIGIYYGAFNLYNNMTLVSNSTTAEAVPTKGDIVMTYSNGAGTVTLNTDLKAYVSRDNGSNYTQMTLASQGTSGGHEIVTAHDVDISSQPSGTAMRYKIETLNQSASKATYIQAVSLGWS